MEVGSAALLSSESQNERHPHRSLGARHWVPNGGGPTAGAPLNTSLATTSLAHLLDTALCQLNLSQEGAATGSSGDDPRIESPSPSRKPQPQEIDPSTKFEGESSRYHASKNGKIKGPTNALHS